MAQKRHKGRDSELEEPRGQRKKRDVELHEVAASSFPRAPLDGSTTLCSIRGSPGLVSVAEACPTSRSLTKRNSQQEAQGEEQQVNV